MLKKIFCATTLLVATGFASAAVIEHEAVIAVQDTDYMETISFPKFDDMSGTRELLSVTFSIDGQMTGYGEVENRDASAQTITTTLSAELTLSNNMNELVVTIPNIVNVFNATAFDGANDAGGTSGITYDSLMATQFESNTYTDAMTLATFTGMGTEDFLFDAVAKSRAEGSGNITTTFLTEAGGTVKVVYNYRPTTEVSAPAHVAFLGLGLLAFAGMRKIRK